MPLEYHRSYRRFVLGRFRAGVNLKPAILKDLLYSKDLVLLSDRSEMSLTYLLVTFLIDGTYYLHISLIQWWLSFTNYAYQPMQTF